MFLNFFKIDHKIKKNIFITGVSSGIGFATAEYLLQHGHTVVGTVRSLQDSLILKKQFESTFFPIVVDLLCLDQIENIKLKLEQLNIHRLDAAVQNAGVALAGPIEYQKFSEVEMILNLNVLAVIKTTQVLLPFLKRAQSPARLVNISSVSGVGGTPFLAAYCASKHAIEGFSEALRRELALYRMKVSIVGPGSIQTPIWDKGFNIVAHTYDKTEYKNSFQKFIQFAEFEKLNALPVSHVVDCINHALFSKSPQLRYEPIPRKFRNWYLPKVIPKSLYDYLMCKALGIVS